MIFSGKKQLTLSLSFIFIVVLSINAKSDVYQWTDEHGQTHFSDRPPHKSEANNISNQLNQINITSDLSSPEMMLRHEQAKDAEREKNYKERQEKYNKQPSKTEACKEAKKLLGLIKGRVVFVDQQGKDLKISEEDRKQRAIELEHEIRKHCQ
jgi:hypothetical protein